MSALKIKIYFKLAEISLWNRWTDPCCSYLRIIRNNHALVCEGNLKYLPIKIDDSYLRLLHTQLVYTLYTHTKHSSLHVKCCMYTVGT